MTIAPPCTRPCKLLTQEAIPARNGSSVVCRDCADVGYDHLPGVIMSLEPYFPHPP